MVVIKRLFALVGIIAALSSCEVPVDVELPHIERLVVDGFVGLSPEDGELRVLRTLPPLARVSVSDMTVPNADVVLEWKGAQGGIFTLQRNPDSVTFALPKEAESWEDGIAVLRVQGIGKTATATTRIPGRPVVLSTRVVDTVSDYGTNVTFVLVDVEVDRSSVIWTQNEFWFFSSDTRPLAGYRQWTLAPFDPLSSSSRTTMRLVVFDRNDYSLPDSVTITITSADPAFERYLRSPYGSGESIFGFSGVNPWFNVQGDGLGLFIGASSTKIKVGLR
ncbi:MAG: DUF4249 family protein [Candidatus Kapabacteria bacterium]|nr:DUF4249 family protein [Candidatus Kapabacteria bacterium]